MYNIQDSANVYSRSAFSKARREQPCRVCGKTDWCSLHVPTDNWHCERIDTGYPARRGTGWWEKPLSAAGRAQDIPWENTNRMQLVEAAPEPKSERASIEVRDHVYATLLQLCPLSKEHRDYLLSCGVLEYEMQHYGTLPTDRRGISAALLRRHDRTQLLQVPGLFDRADGAIGISAPAGMLVAVRDEGGDITALQCRVVEADGRKRYLWLSSTGHAGPGPGSPAHVAPWGDTRLLWLTEGAKKANLTARYTGCTTVGMPGHSVQDDALRVLAILRVRGALDVVIAVDEDEDPATAAAVAGSRIRLAEACLQLGLAVRIARWNAADAKGIDDLLLAGKEPVITLYVRDPGPGTGKDDTGLLHDLCAILESPLPDGEKITAMGLRRVLGADHGELQHVFLDQVVAKAGLRSTCSQGSAVKRAGQMLLNLRDRGIATRDASDRDPSNDHVRLQFALSLDALPSPTAIIAPAPRALAERERKRRQCSACGSSWLHVVCRSCGHVEALDPTDPAIIVADAPPAPRPLLTDQVRPPTAAAAATPLPDTITGADTTAVPYSRIPGVDSKALNSRNPGVGSVLLQDSGSRPTAILPLQLCDSADPIDGAVLPPHCDHVGRPEGVCAGCGRRMWTQFSPLGGDPLPWYCRNCGLAAPTSAPGA